MKKQQQYRKDQENAEQVAHAARLIGSANHRRTRAPQFAFLGCRERSGTVTDSIRGAFSTRDVVCLVLPPDREGPLKEEIANGSCDLSDTSFLRGWVALSNSIQ
jgi:hypothetical protein